MEVITPVASGLGKGFLWYFKLSLTLLFFIYLLVHSVALAIKEKDAMVVVKQLGSEMFSPIQSAQEQLNNFKTEGFFGSIWSYWGLFYELYKIYLWLWLLTLGVNFFIGNVAPIFRVLSSVLLFYLIQLIYCTIFLQDPFLPFIATKDIFFGLINLVTNPQFDASVRNPFSNLKVTNNCTESICTI